MKRPMLPMTRRSFILSPLIALLACLGCGGERISVNEKAGEKRRLKAEALHRKAELKQKPRAKRPSAR